MKHWQYCVGAAALATILGSSVAVAATPPAPVTPEVLAALDTIMTRDISDSTPGCVLGLHSRDVDVLRAYGQADLERHVAMDVDNVFNIASSSKQFTAAAVLMLANEGKLALDDDIRKYLPELPLREQPITIDHLLSHTSGLRDYRFTDWMTGRDALAQRNQDILEYAARQQSLNHAPGQSHLYSNTGYILLAIIVERASGRRFADFTRERLFEPAGMTQTHWEVDSQRLVDKRAAGYALAEPAQDGKPARFMQMPTARNTFGAGNLLSTAGDMQRWNAALARNAFGAKITTQLEEPARLRNGFVLDYARGEFVGKYRGLREVQHGGYNGAYVAWVGRYPEVDLSMSLLCNGDADNINPYDIIDLFLPQHLPARAPGRARGSDDLTARNGVYRRLADGQLALWTFPGRARLDGTRLQMGPNTYEFDPARPERIVRHTYGNATEWTRVPEWKPAVATLGEFQGRFASDELLASYDVALDGQQLKMTLRGMSSLTASLQPRAADVFEAQGLPQMEGLLVVFRRDPQGLISGFDLAPDQLHDLPFRKVEVD